MSQSVLPNSQYANIRRLTANAIAGNVYHYNTVIGASADLNSRLDPIPDASYARDKAGSPPDSECLLGTREGVIEKVTVWADKDIFSSSSHVYWLYGYAGCGKSSISQAVAERFHNKGRLVASFFFFRSSDRRSGFKSVPATLASQMAEAIPAIAPLILAALQADFGLLFKPVGTQMELLVYKPFRTAIERGLLEADTTAVTGSPFLITIDGLDECEDKRDVEQFIDHMLSYFSKNPLLPLRFFITSRVEEHIRTCLSTNEVCLDNLANYSPDEDIIAFIYARFARAAKNDRIVRAYGGTWPDPRDVRGLAELANKSFIFISMLLKYIFETANDGLTPMQRLPRALEMRSTLDDLYAATLRRSEHLPHFSSIISTLTYSQRPLPTSSIAELLNIELYEVIAVLVNLQAIIQLPGDDITPVTFCHSSLQDFLTTETRSGPLFSHPNSHENMAYQCLDLLTRHQSFIYRFNDRSGLAYASRRLGTHLELASKALDYNQGYYDRIAYMNQQFPTLFPLVLSILLRMKGIQRRNLSKLLVNLLAPNVPLFDLELMAEVLIALCDNPNGHRVLNSSTQFRSLLAPDAAHYTFLAKQCVRHLVDSWQRLEGGSIFSAVHLDTLEYVFVYWAKHIELAVIHDPAMDLEDLQEDFVLSHVHRPPMFSPVVFSRPDIRQMMENIALAVEAIQNKFPGTVVSNVDRLGNLVVEVRSPVSILTLLAAFRQLNPTQPSRLLFGGEGAIFTISVDRYWHIDYSLKYS